MNLSQALTFVVPRCERVYNTMNSRDNALHFALYLGLMHMHAFSHIFKYSGGTGGVNSPLSKSMIG